MNKKELIDAIAAAGFTKADTARFIDAFTAVVTNTVVSGEKVVLQNFGTFETVWRSPRIGRNPGTGESVAIDGQYSPRFTPGKAMRSAVLNNRR